MAEAVPRAPGSAGGACSEQDGPYCRQVQPRLRRKVSREEGEQAAAELKLRHFEVSAKTGRKVSELFEEILDIVLQQMRREEEFVESTREKLKDLHTIVEEGVEPKPESKPPLALGSRTVELASKVKCCGSG